MERFAWSFDGIPFAERRTAAPELRRAHAHRAGQRHDDAAPDPPARPVERPGGRVRRNFQVRKHTIDMPPGTKRSYRVRADALGRWAFHCHLLYHMEAGMMREVRVEE
jgi:FtsP/CotA-like multicopper oxidase with cupredoxin domain